MNKKVEIMAPAGSYESLRAAIKAGANSIYFGIELLNMRARAANKFTLKDLKEIINICQEKGVKTYLTLNTIMYDQDLDLMKNICNQAKEAGISAIIASDISAIQYAHSINLEVHISTQANVSNLEAVKFYAHFADVIVLARELNLEQIKNISEEIKKQEIKGPNGKLVEIELFVHGALCVSISGKCYMSLATYNLSANRGSCLQNCRRAYKVIDEETGEELIIENKYVMSPKDLCTIGFIDKLLEAGVSVLKIEGRGRAPEYVYTTVKIYKEAVDSYLAGTYSPTKIKLWTNELEAVFNRGFWHGGHYLGKKLGEWSGTYGSKATKKKVALGIVINYYREKNIGEFYLESGGINLNDEIIITGPTTGVMKTKVGSLFVNNKTVNKVEKGESFTMLVPERVRPNDKLYLLIKTKLD